MNRFEVSGLLASALLIPLVTAVAVVVWPPAPLLGVLLGAVFVLAVVAVTTLVVGLQRQTVRARVSASAARATATSPKARLEERLASLEEWERRLELRELRLARRLRVHELVDDERHLDLLEPHPADAELAVLVETDRKLIALIEAESQLAFERVLENRYATADGGVDTALIFGDVSAFVEKVARLYQPDTEHPLLETDLELVAKSASSTALHLLVMVDELPIDLKSYNVARLYRLIRRAASYYGTWKAVLPYLEHGMSALHVARLALGANPLAAGATWLAGKLTSQGARAVTERVLQQQALQLLHDFVRVIGFEAAMVYGGRFRHRDANYILAAELVNLEISRGEDRAGRDAAFADLCRLAFRHEFDRTRLVRHLGTGRRVEVEAARPQVVLTRQEREAVATHLTRHCLSTGVDLDAAAVVRWRQGVEMRLGLPLELRAGVAAHSPLGDIRSALEDLGNPLERLQASLRRRSRARRERAQGRDAPGDTAERPPKAPEGDDTRGRDGTEG